MKTKERKFKGALAIGDLPTIIVLIGVGIFAVAIVAQILSSSLVSYCSADGYTYGSFPYSAAANPWSGIYTGCCQSINASNSTDCDTWASGGKYNVTGYGISGISTFGDWWSIIVLAVVFIIILGLLYALIGKRKSTGGY